MKLSVLMCSLPDRYPIETMEYFDKQREVEFIYLGDNRQWTTGMKRNKLIDLANGEYVVFIDDDDVLSDDFIDELLQGIKTGCDIINYDVMYHHVKSGKEKLVKYSMKFKRDYNDNPEYYERLPNHLMCVKWQIAKLVRYPDKTFGEDADYAKRLRHELKSEHNIDKVLYTYKDAK